MKHLVTLIALFLCASNNMHADGGHRFTVSGVFNQIYEERLPADRIIYIKDVVTRETLGKTKVQDDLSFCFSGTFDGEPRFAYLNDSMKVPFILEEGDIHIYTRPYRSRGTRLNDAAFAIIEKLEKASEEQVEPLFPEINDTTIPIDLRMPIYDKYRIMQDSLYAQILKTEISGEFANGPVNAYILDKYMFLLRSYKSFCDYWDLCGTPIKTMPKYVQMKKSFDSRYKHGDGTNFIDCVIPQGNLDGTDVKFSDYIGQGKYILVDFWASWCGPCRKELPNVKSVYEDYHGADFEVVSVACWDKPAATLKAIQEEQLLWPQIINAQSIATDAYGISGIPEIILFAPDGTIIERGLRGIRLREVVEKSLKIKKE